MTVSDRGVELSHLSGATAGVFPRQLLVAAHQAGWIDAGDRKVVHFQPASLDLRLGETAYRMRCSFLPNGEEVRHKMKQYVIDEVDLRREGAFLDVGRPYLIQLEESLNLPGFVAGKANPKSSTGRVDVFTRVITDGGNRFDEIPPGYSGPLWLEVVPLSFAVRVNQGLALNQLRLSIGRSLLTDEELRREHGETPLLYRDRAPLAADELDLSDGLFLSLDLRPEGSRDGGPAYRARENAPPIDLSRERTAQPEEFWEQVSVDEPGRAILSRKGFYLLMSREAVVIPPGLAAEMTAYDPTSGELRTHYAGFFDPGFGYDAAGDVRGSRAALEVRVHDVPFLVEHGQPVCKLTFERMIEEPDVLYGAEGSHYQGQTGSLGKHFLAPLPPRAT
ncbi:MAG TPA: 2'-deoxycytidine 5'-triphosphate deaminase [Acidimicrobiales bacterium]|nr:2'-deoxycytidine 5'-triphosphate deaminase [Acidimicrobiales bacterium]